MEIISRKAAKAQGLAYYFTGKPCVNGHICKRYVCTYCCYQCDYDRNRIVNMTEEQRLLKNKNQIKWANKPENKQRYLERQRVENMTPEQVELKRKKQRVENLEEWRILANRSNSRRIDAKRIHRVPKWSELKEIKLFYLNCPIDYHVDHIIPLCGELVSGLHVLSNLQYLPAEENLKKGNKYDIS